MGNLFTYPKFRAVDSKRDPLVGGKLYTYLAGTNTPKATYIDTNLNYNNRNPIILDWRGEATIYGSGKYKFVLKDSNDNTIWTMDEIDTTLGGSVVGLAAETYVDTAEQDAKDWAAERFITENLLEEAQIDNNYRTIWIPAGFMVPTTTSGCAALATNEYATNDINMDYLAFDGTTEEYAECQFVMDEAWDRSTIKAKFIWSSATGSTAGDTVEWEIAAGALSDNDTIDTALGTSQVISDTLLANNGTKLQFTSATPKLVVGGAPALGDLLHFKVSRNVGGTDNMTEDAWLFGVWLQYRKSFIAAEW